MKVLNAILALSAVAVAQEIAADKGDALSEGDSAITHSNVNNGEQTTNSLISSGSKGGNKFHNLSGNTFKDTESNVGISDSNIINASETTVKGNSGDTANGSHNRIGVEEEER
ncbi:hypothetical protein LPJ61_006157, partial [Coemansia biformis]